MAFRAVVVDVRQEGRARWQLLLDRTEFGVGDGGRLEAVARSGARLVIPVLGIVAGTAGEVWHVVEKPLGAGTEVEAVVERGGTLPGARVGGAAG